jgi:hypothetical protein
MRERRPPARARFAFAAVAGLLAGLPGAASADSYYCTLHGSPPGSEGSWLCAGTDTAGETGWSPMVGVPDGAGETSAAASSAGSAGGDFAASAAASANADPGLLRAEATASAFGTGSARGSAGAQASMYEEGTFAPLGGAAPGTPLTARLTIDVAGAFAGTPAGADGQVIVSRGITVLAQRTLFLSLVDGDFFEEIELPGLIVGDTVSLFMIIRAFASAQDVGVTASSADLGSSGRLSLDVLSGNASFDAASGHDYTTVPEPGAALLLLVGAAVLARCRPSTAPRRTQRSVLDLEA